MREWLANSLFCGVTTYLKQIPIAHFLVISQALPPDPALASSGGQLTSPQDKTGPLPSACLSLVTELSHNRFSCLCLHWTFAFLKKIHKREEFFQSTCSSTEATFSRLLTLGHYKRRKIKYVKYLKRYQPRFAKTLYIWVWEVTQSTLTVYSLTNYTTCQQTCNVQEQLPVKLVLDYVT